MEKEYTVKSETATLNERTNEETIIVTEDDSIRKAALISYLLS